MRIGIILKNLDEEYQTSVFSGISEKSRELGLDLVCLHGIGFDAERNVPVPPVPPLDFLGLDGMLLLSSIIVDNLESGVQWFCDMAGNIPLVSIGARFPGCPSVLADNDTSIKDLCDHLLYAHSYRKFLYIGGPVSNRDNRIRENIIRESMREAGASGLDVTLSVKNGDLFSDHDGIVCIKEYVREHPERDIDVIIAGSDHTAFGVMKYLKACGIAKWAACPVTGFDDLPYACYAGPGLTTVHQPLTELGSTAVQVLYGYIKGIQVPEETMILSLLKIRASCGCPDLPDYSGLSGNKSIFASNLRNLSMSRDAGYFAQALMNADGISGIIAHLSEFLVDVNTDYFSLFQFPEPCMNIPSRAHLVYCRDAVSGDIPLPEDPYVSMHGCIEDFFVNGRRGGNPLFVFLLCSGNDKTGMMLYSVEAASLPYMSNCGVLLSHAFTRLRMLDREKAYSETLETLVAERTEELRRESERRIDVEEQILKISELERKRFSMDLHDDICQRLAGIAMICKNYSKDNPLMQTLAKMADDALSQTRQYAYSSFPVDIGNAGFREALSDLCAEIEKQSDATCCFVCPRDFPDSFGEQIEVNLYRIAREALFNAARHASADMIELNIRLKPGFIVMNVTDNGCGSLDTGSGCMNDKDARRPRGLGIRSMQFRAHQINAGYAMRSEPGKGTQVEILVPCK